MTAHVCDECDLPAVARTPHGDWCAEHLAVWEAAQEAARDDAERTTDYEDWVSARMGRRRPSLHDGSSGADAYWDARIDEARGK